MSYEKLKVSVAAALVAFIFASGSIITVGLLMNSIPQKRVSLKTGALDRFNTIIRDSKKSTGSGFSVKKEDEEIKQNAGSLRSAASTHEEESSGRKLGKRQNQTGNKKGTNTPSFHVTRAPRVHKKRIRRAVRSRRRTRAS